MSRAWSPGAPLTHPRFGSLRPDAETFRAPWWLVAVTAAEAYASLRRVVLKLSRAQGSAPPRSLSPPPTQQQRRSATRVRHFTSMRLADGSPVDEIVARFLALDEMSEVSGPDRT